MKTMPRSEGAVISGPSSLKLSTSRITDRAARMSESAAGIMPGPMAFKEPMGRVSACQRATAQTSSRKRAAMKSCWLRIVRWDG
jgi:hypothetical protein